MHSLLSGCGPETAMKLAKDAPSKAETSQGARVAERAPNAREQKCDAEDVPLTRRTLPAAIRDLKARGLL